MYRWNDAILLEAGDWIVTAYAEDAAYLEESIIEHIQLPQGKLVSLIKVLKSKHWMLEIRTKGYLWHFKKHGHWYTYYLVNDINELLSESQAEKVSTLMPGVYWTSDF